MIAPVQSMLNIIMVTFKNKLILKILDFFIFIQSHFL